MKLKKSSTKQISSKLEVHFQSKQKSPKLELHFQFLNLPYFSFRPIYFGFHPKRCGNIYRI